MLTRTVPPQWDGKRLDRFLFDACPERPGAEILRAFKKRDIKVNGIRSREDAVLRAGDVVEAYLPDTVRTPSDAPDPSGPSSDMPLGPRGTAGAPGGGATVPEIAYEDESLLIVVKPQGIAVQETEAVGDADGDAPFDTQVRAWFQLAHPGADAAYPALCHRLDRNTGGLLMFAKNARALRDAETALREHRIRKLYRCFVAGIPSPASAELHAWLEKDAAAGRVYIHEAARRGAQPICTRYRVLAGREDVALLEVEIVTGRTHQIRAQLARIGHPILGDSRYGSNAVNRRFRLTRQALWACRLTFARDAGGCLSGLAGRTIRCGIPVTELPGLLRALIAEAGAEGMG